LRPQSENKVGHRMSRGVSANNKPIALAADPMAGGVGGL
jgi:hypothetical protein